MQKIIRIATRESALAMWQAVYVQKRLQDAYPEAEVILVPMTTKGDQILDKTLSKVGGKGLFVKELELAMLEGRADLAVHSLKDVPMELPDGFTLAAVSDREDPRDAFVSTKYSSIEEMPEGSVVGTSSLRRELMIRSHYPKLTVKSIRGNVNTRLRKLDAGEYDALVMAGAGLKRLGFESRIRTLLPESLSLPSPGQGALGIECLSSNKALIEDLQFLNNDAVHVATAAERTVSRALGGSCQLPLAAYATVKEDTMEINALVGDHRSGKTLRTFKSGPLTDAQKIAMDAVNDLLGQGAQSLLDAVLKGA